MASSSSSNSWTKTEKLALACAVVKNGDGNWPSVSRSVKPFMGDHPPEVSSQRNCATQYAQLLREVEPQKRKRGEKEVRSEPPSVLVQRKMTLERLDELREIIQRQRNEYLDAKETLDDMESGKIDDETISKMAKSKVKELGPEMFRVEGGGGDISSGILDGVDLDTRRTFYDTFVAENDNTDEIMTSVQTGIEIKAPEKIETNIDYMYSNAFDNRHTGDKTPTVPRAGNEQSSQTSNSASLLLTNELTPSVTEPDNIVVGSCGKVTDDDQVQPAMETGFLHSIQGCSEAKPMVIDAAKFDATPHNYLEVSSKEQLTKEEKRNFLEDLLATSPGKSQNKLLDILASEESNMSSSGNEPKNLKEMVNKEKETVADASGTVQFPIGFETAKILLRESYASALSSCILQELLEKDSPQSPASLANSSGVSSLKHELQVTSAQENTLNEAMQTSSNVQQVQSTSTVNMLLDEHPYAKNPNLMVVKENPNYDTNQESNADKMADLVKEEPKEEAVADAVEPSMQDERINEDSVKIMPAAEEENVPEACEKMDEVSFQSWKKSILLVWKNASSHRYAKMFATPINPKSTPNYNKVVHQPMDLSTIKKNIETGEIKSTAEFQRDLMLMFNNALMYHPADSKASKMAREMYDDVMHNLEHSLSVQLMLGHQSPLAESVDLSHGGMALSPEIQKGKPSVEEVQDCVSAEEPKDSESPIAEKPVLAKPKRRKCKAKYRGR